MQLQKAKFESITELYTNLFELVLDSKSKEIEMTLIQIIEEGIKNNAVGLLAQINIIYIDFNQLFSLWLRSKSLPRSFYDRSIHQNRLLSKCTDPASMDDIMFMIMRYVQDPQEEKKTEILHDIDCYKAINN